MTNLKTNLCHIAIKWKKSHLITETWWIWYVTAVSGIGSHVFIEDCIRLNSRLCRSFSPAWIQPHASKCGRLCFTLQQNNELKLEVLLCRANNNWNDRRDSLYDLAHWIWNTIIPLTPWAQIPFTDTITINKKILKTNATWTGCFIRLAEILTMSMDYWPLFW